MEEQIARYQNELISQINHLIIGERQRFIEQYGEGDTVTYRTVKGLKLTDAIIKKHLCGKKTIGIFYCKGASKFLCFDIDDKDELKPRLLISALKEAGIREEDIHLESSGMKGWHIWLFFSQPIQIARLVHFGKLMLERIGAYGCECQPKC